MILKRLKPIDQTADYMEDLCKKNGTTVSCCGYITLAIIQYLSQLEKFDPSVQIPKINQISMTPYIQKVMRSLQKSRKIEIKKFYNKMNESQRKNYSKDWVANFQVSDYLASISQKMLNNQVCFFRQSAYDHPQALKTVKFQQQQRIKQQEQFKGEKLFYTRFCPQLKNMRKQEFSQQIKMSDRQKPIIIATDVLGHFNVTILFKGAVYILDSLPDKASQYDPYIVQYIENVYKKSYLIK